MNVRQMSVMALDCSANKILGMMVVRIYIFDLMNSRRWERKSLHGQGDRFS